MSSVKAVKARADICEVAGALGPKVRGNRMTAAWRNGDGLTVSLDRDEGLFYDHRDGKGGDVFDLVRLSLDCGFSDARSWLAEFYGIARDGEPCASRPREPEPRLDATEADRSRIHSALTRWRETVPLPDTIGELYFAKRGLSAENLGHAVRWHRSCPFASSRHPCVAALMRDPLTDEPIGIHRTALTPGGEKIGRRMLGKAGVVKFSPVEDVLEGLGIAEGIETALSILQAGWSPMWAVGSAGAIERFPYMPGVEHLTVWADHDDVGLKAAKMCAQRWAGSGAGATVRYPEAANSDFNDRRPR
jgi:hypothetical protein